MVVVTKAAIDRITAEMKGTQIKPLRIYMTKEKGSTWSCGFTLSLALDELKTSNDNVYEIEGFQFVVNKSLEKPKLPLKVDFGPKGFVIS